ncbi:hypothetical protein T4A_5612 [Trichinella pseudospiralis]|uniref:Uncharacterized protein n=1 Tax=Trichinella pseudospiralis TaxID=6337 RepID=A0A0V1AK04_TRIPS|nr:hypothetical protein T4A_5612 [Trichinella pseudospiralis]
MNLEIPDSHEFNQNDSCKHSVVYTLQQTQKLQC